MQTTDHPLAIDITLATEKEPDLRIEDHMMTGQGHQSADSHPEEMMIGETGQGPPQDVMIVDVQGHHMIAIDQYNEQDRLYLEGHDRLPMDREDQHVSAPQAQIVEVTEQVDRAMAQILQIGDVC